MPAIPRVTGTRDLLPATAAVFEWLQEVHREVASSHGYRPVDLPVLEHSELIARGIGAGTDVVDKEMYAWVDKDAAHIALRPEGTVGAVRALLSANTEDQPRPLRVRYQGPMFRRDRPQRGRYRQFVQVGVECIGERSPWLDAEVIEAGARFFQAIGLEGVVLQINSLGALEDRQRFRAVLTAYYRQHYQELCEDCRHRLEVNPLRLLDCKRDAGLVAAAPRIEDSLSPESAAYFHSVLGALDAAGIPYTRNPRLVRGLDYYAHTAFEYQHVSLQGAQNALGGGGRYDGLAALLGFPATAGVGYALGIDRIALLAEEQRLMPPHGAAEVLVIALEPAQALEAAAQARALRGAGLRCVLDAGARKLDRKLRQADRLGARFAVLIGSDEASAAEVTVRDLQTRTQERMAVAALPGRMRTLVHNGEQP